jgi:hypothetical protein
MNATDEYAAYREELILALRHHEVPGERIGEVLAEVETHVAESGVGPRDAFGPPQEYAAQLAQVYPRAGESVPRWRRVLGGVVLPGLIGLLTAESVWALATGQDLRPQALHVPGWAGLVGVVVLAAIGWWLQPLRADLIRDPRTGAEASGIPRWVMWVAVAMMATPLVLGAVIGWATRP